MGLRYQRRINLLRGLRLNLSRSGVSATVGRSGASVTFRPGRKTTVSAGLPGTGLSYRAEIPRQGLPQRPTTRWGWVALGVLAIAVWLLA